MPDSSIGNELLYALYIIVCLMYNLDRQDSRVEPQYPNSPVYCFIACVYTLSGDRLKIAQGEYTVYYSKLKRTIFERNFSQPIDK